MGGAAEPDSGYTVLGDQPFDGDDPGGDPLGFHEVARRLADLVAASSASSPFTLGVEGDWGSGKSSLMGRLEKELGGRGVHTVWFNPWTEEGNDALEGLIRSALGEIDGNVLRRAMRKKQLLSWAGLVVGLAAGWLRVGNAVDRLWERLRVDVEARNQVRDLVAQAMRSWLDKTSGTRGRLLAVFIDDLDRCSPENVLKVFEAVKLYLDVPGFVFVLGYDRNVISDSILRQKSYGPSVRAVDYIEKIVQITYTLGAPTEDAAQRLVEGYLAQAGIAGLLAESERGLLAARNARNPRRIKRFVNNFVIEYQLDAEWRELGSPLLIRALLLEMYYPGLVSRAGRGRDPIGETLDYARAVRVLKRDAWRAQGPREAGEPDADAGFLRGFFDSYNLALPSEAPSGQLLGILRDEVPEAVVAAGGDDEFLSLAESLGDEAARGRLLAKLAGRGADAAPETGGVAAGRPADAVAPTVFINYRHEDTAACAARLAEALEREPGRVTVLLDRNLIPGQDWRSALHRQLEASDVVLVLIGPRWLEARDPEGGAKLGAPEDYLTSEIVDALGMRKVVIPVLVGGARFPAELPPHLARLTRRQAAVLRDTHWDSDVARLLDAIRGHRDGTGHGTGAFQSQSAEEAPAPEPPTSG
jgi:hypothetical protein